MKKTLLTIIAALLLGGVVNAQDWGETDSHAKSSNTPIVASVKLDGNAVTPTADYRLGAFVGEELRGLAAPHTDNNFWIQVFYNKGTTETISFKLYDGNNEYTTCSVTQTTQEEGWGTPTNPVVLDFANSQRSQMATGWNWWSTYVELENGGTGLSMLENSLGNNGLIIKHKSAYLEPLDLGDEILWIGDIESISNEKLYMIRVSAPCEVVINGGRASVAEHQIPIEYGWNWIGYPHYQQLNLEDALNGFAEEGDIIKNRTTYNEYFFGMWIGDIVTLDPGQGYMYYSNSNTIKYLTYQTGSKNLVTPSISQANNFFTPNVGDYAHNMTITSVIEIDEQELRSDNYEIAAFVNGECRGSAKIKYVEPLDRYVALLLAFGDENEDMYFQLTDGNGTEWSIDHMCFKSDSKFGSLSNPYVLHFGNTSIGENQVNATIYPNPSKDIFNVQSVGIVKVEVVDIYGQIVLSKEVNEDNIQVDLRNKSTGVYLLRVITNDGMITKQLIKE